MSGGPGGGPRRRQPQYAPQYHHHHQHMGPMYPGYMPYGPQGYYGMPPQFPNGGAPTQGYMPYQGYSRSPPSMSPYVPMVGVSVPPNYARPAQQSPNLSTTYQPPPVPTPIPPQTPSSSHSSQVLPPPTPPTPKTVDRASVPPPAFAPVAAPLPPLLSAQVRDHSPVKQREPFRPPLPWYSCPDTSFPTKTPRTRRRRKPLTADSAAVSLPVEQHGSLKEHGTPFSGCATDANVPPHARGEETRPEEALHSDHLSEVRPASSTAQPDSSLCAETRTKAVETTTGLVDERPSGPAHPVLPALPRQTHKASTGDKADDSRKQANDGGSTPVVNGASVPAETTTADAYFGANDAAAVSPPVKAAPASWAGLFAKPPPRPTNASAGANGSAAVNGFGACKPTLASTSSNLAMNSANSLAEALRDYQVGGGGKISFLEPRGLINTGNMCYMNSVLQVLMYCHPFHDFLHQVSKRAMHSFKSETPLLDAMIMFMQEYKVLDSAPSAEQLQRKLKSDDFNTYGEPFTPEFVYGAIRQLPRFASMRRGHQQDAEEFLGFLLQSLDDDCTHIMHSFQSSDFATAPIDVRPGQGSAKDPSGDWLEVGRKQRAAVTRSLGSNSSTPITKIFGGLLRSEFRVPGLKDSITTEPYQPLQLDIGSPDVRNVIDALRGLTRLERIQGDFNSPRGKDVVATKQVFIESLPPVLILHLKRFQFDAEGHGTVKIWKKVGYPLELEIPREALSRQKRQAMGDGAIPSYRLISVVYHHGKNASGGHYTVDVRRQDGRKWIRMDDTVLRRVRSEDVAEGGSEEEVRDNLKENADANASVNRFGAMNDDDTGDEDGWKQVTASTGGNKRWSSVVNGGSNGNAKEKQQQLKESTKDSKVAYLLFYQRV